MLATATRTDIAGLRTFDAEWPERFIALINERLDAGATPYTLDSVRRLGHPARRTLTVLDSRWTTHATARHADAQHRLTLAEAELAKQRAATQAAAFEEDIHAFPVAYKRYTAALAGVTTARADVLRAAQELADASDPAALHTNRIAALRVLEGQLRAWLAQQPATAASRIEPSAEVRFARVAVDLLTQVLGTLPG